ncbi:MAG: transcriptional repressor LexA [Verrucomicrobiales bacterium]
MNPLTARQQELFDFIVQAQNDSGFPPSTREIQQHFGFASQTAVMHHLRALEKKGALERSPKKARALSLPQSGAKAQLISIPLYGTIPAGLSSSQDQETDACVTLDPGQLGIPRSGRTFALRVRGDSMLNAHILNGDIVILEFREPKHGDIVAALIDGETTLKRYVMESPQQAARATSSKNVVREDEKPYGKTRISRDRAQPYLKAENPKYPDLIPARELVIQGVMIALLRGRVQNADAS